MWLTVWFDGVTVSTWDFESQDPSSNLGRTFLLKKTKQEQQDNHNVSFPLGAKASSSVAGVAEVITQLTLDDDAVASDLEEEESDENMAKKYPEIYCRY